MIAATSTGKFGKEKGAIGVEVEAVLRAALEAKDMEWNAKGLIAACKASSAVSDDIKKVLSQRTPSVISTMKRVAKEYKGHQVLNAAQGPAFAINYSAVE